MTNDSGVLLAAALRDFFLSRDAEELERAHRGVAMHSGVPLAGPVDWEEAEFAFNRLFVGPRAPEAPPFASVYLDGDGQLMGASTLKAREAYARLGLESPWKGGLPDDHVGLELDAALAMGAVADGGDVPGLAALRRDFVAGHMGSWIPAFIARVVDAPSSHPAVDHAARMLARWLADEIAALDDAA